MSYARISKKTKEHTKKRLVLARKTLNSLPKLKKLLNNFNDLEEEVTIENPFFWHAHAVSSPHLFDEIARKKYLKEFIEVEKSLEPKKIDNHMKKRATGNFSDDARSLYFELIALGNLIIKNQEENIIKNPKIGGKCPEWCISKEGKKYFLEQTSIFEGKTELKMKKILQDVCEFIYGHLNERTYLSITTNPMDFIIDKKERFDVDKTVRLFKRLITSLNLNSIFNLHNIPPLPQIWDFSELNGVSKTKLADDLPLLKYFGESGNYLHDQVKNPIFNKLLNANVEELSKLPIISFFSLPHNGKVVQIQVEHFFPSTAATNERDAWFRSIKRKIIFKAKKGQLPSGERNILLINARLWSLRDYHDPNDPDNPIFLNQLNSLISEIRSEEIFIDDFSAIVFYNGGLSKKFIFLNESASKPISIEEINSII